MENSRDESSAAATTSVPSAGSLVSERTKSGKRERRGHGINGGCVVVAAANRSTETESVAAAERYRVAKLERTANLLDVSQTTLTFRLFV